MGNVLGQPGVQTAYVGTRSRTIYILGSGNGLNKDPNVALTALRWGNYDVITGANRFCGNASDTGWSSTCGHTSEVPVNLSGVQSAYSNPVPSYGDTGAKQPAMPASFYAHAIPSWWPKGKPWPPIGPDVTGGNIGGLLAGHAYTIPAEDCYLKVMEGNSDGTGGPYGFNERKCYSAPAP